MIAAINFNAVGQLRMNECQFFRRHLALVSNWLPEAAKKKSMLVRTDGYITGS